MKITWLQKFDNDHKDSIWWGGDIVSIKVGRYIVTIGAYGDIRCFINGEYYCDKCNGGMFYEYLNEQGIHNDDDLRKAKIEFENNNWYEAYIWDDVKKDYVSNTWDSIIDELDRNDDFKWIKPWLKEIVRD